MQRYCYSFVCHAMKKNVSHQSNHRNIILESLILSKTVRVHSKKPFAFNSAHLHTVSGLSMQDNMAIRTAALQVDE